MAPVVGAGAGTVGTDGGPGSRIGGRGIEIDMDMDINNDSGGGMSSATVQGGNWTIRISTRRTATSRDRTCWPSCMLVELLWKD